MNFFRTFVYSKKSALLVFLKKMLYNVNVQAEKIMILKDAQTTF